MTISIGMLIPPKLGGLGIESVAGWAKAQGLGALDLPVDFGAAAQACKTHGLRLGAVWGASQGELLNPDDGTRAEAVRRLQVQIQAMPAVGATVLFLCLVPENISQSIVDSLAIYRETFPAIAAACEQAGVRAVFEGWPGPAPLYPTLAAPRRPGAPCSRRCPRPRWG